MEIIPSAMLNNDTTYKTLTLKANENLTKNIIMQALGVHLKYQFICYVYQYCAIAKC